MGRPDQVGGGQNAGGGGEILNLTLKNNILRQWFEILEAKLILFGGHGWGPLAPSLADLAPGQFTLRPCACPCSLLPVRVVTVKVRMGRHRHTRMKCDLGSSETSLHLQNNLLNNAIKDRIVEQHDQLIS